MQSHTVPKKLLEQFAYDDPKTRSKRLWQYQKDVTPWWKASPKTATRWDGHFADPLNPQKEAEVELRLKRDFEDPTNEFLQMLNYRTFAFTATHVRTLTGYITMLFNRSKARRTAGVGLNNLRVQAFRALLDDDELLSALLAKYNLDFIKDGQPVDELLTKEQLKEIIEERIANGLLDESVQSTYVQSVETMMAFVDEKMKDGQWNVIHTNPEAPFVIGDTPVVTWERSESNLLTFGIGFARPNVEVLLPVSPTACLHVLPWVERTRFVKTPTTQEVNRAQAALASQHCFTNICSADVDALLQPEFGTIRLGIEGFSIGHIDYKKSVFNILMGRDPNVP